MRRRHREGLKREIARTPGQREGIEAEIRYLLAALGRAKGELQ